MSNKEVKKKSKKYRHFFLPYTFLYNQEKFLKSPEKIPYNVYGLPSWSSVGNQFFVVKIDLNFW